MNMNHEEKYLAERFGRKQPFKVPEGYFEQFNAGIMAKLPSCSASSKLNGGGLKATRWQRLRPFAAAAAVMAMLVSGAWLYLQRADGRMNVAETLAKSEKSMSATGNFDRAADYTMMENEDFYACVAEY